MKGTAMKPKVAIIDNSIDPELYKPVEHWSSYLAAVPNGGFLWPARSNCRGSRNFTHSS